MAHWSEPQLLTLYDANEIRITPADERSPGRLIWVVVVDERVFVRSWKGPEKTWYRDVVAADGARIAGQDVETDVAVRRTGEFDEAIDLEFLRKYGDPSAHEMNEPLARDTTLELLPRGDGA